MSRRPISWVDLLLILVAVIWGVNAAVVKVSLAQGFATLSFNSLRFVVATLASWVLLVAAQRNWNLRMRDVPGLFLMGLLGHTLYQYLFIEGTYRTTAGDTSILLATIPIHVAWISILLGTEQSRWSVWGGLFLSFAGILLVFGTDSSLFSLASGHTLGNALIVGAGLVMGLYTALSKRWLSVYTPLEFSTYTMTLGTIPLLLLSAPSLARQEWSTVSATGWSGLFFSALLALSLSYYLWNRGLQQIGSTRTAMYGNLPPVFAMLSGAAWLGETVTWTQAAGALLIVGGVIVARFGGQLAGRGTVRPKPGRQPQ